MINSRRAKLIASEELHSIEDCSAEFQQKTADMLSLMEGIKNDEAARILFENESTYSSDERDNDESAVYFADDPFFKPLSRKAAKKMNVANEMKFVQSPTIENDDEFFMFEI